MAVGGHPGRVPDRPRAPSGAADHGRRAGAARRFPRTTAPPAGWVGRAAVAKRRCPGPACEDPTDDQLPARHEIRDLYAEGAAAPGRVLERADDAYLGSLARAVTGGLGGRVGIAPRVFLKKLVQDVLDRIDLHSDFDPRRDYALTLTDGELTDVERNARAAATPDDVELGE